MYLLSNKLAIYVSPAILALVLSMPSFASAQDQYLVGDWNGDGKDDIAARIGNRLLMDTDSDGLPDSEQVFGNGNSESQYLVGDWDGDGQDNIAVRRGNRVLMDTNFDDTPDIEQTFGSDENEPDEYLVGDWDGDGRDNIASRKGSRFAMDTNFDSQQDLVRSFGPGRETEYLVGDWDGDGTTDFAVRSGSTVLMDTNFDEIIDIEQTFGNDENEPDEYLVGDWDGDGRDNVAVRRGNRILMDTNFDATPDLEFTFSVEPALAVTTTPAANSRTVIGTRTMPAANGKTLVGAKSKTAANGKTLRGAKSITKQPGAVDATTTPKTKIKSGGLASRTPPIRTSVTTGEVVQEPEVTQSPTPTANPGVVQGEVTIVGQPATSTNPSPTAPGEAAPAPTTGDPGIVQAEVVITGPPPTPATPPTPVEETAPTPAPAIGGALNVAPSGVVVTENPLGIQGVMFNGNNIGLATLAFPEGTNYIGGQVYEDRQKQVLMRLYGMPYGTYSMLEEAARRHLIHKSKSATPEAVAAYLQSVYDNPELRLGLAAPLLVEGVEAILADDRTEAQTIFYTAFSRYSGAIEYRATASLYQSWKFFKGDGAIGIQPVVEYKPNTLGVLLDTGKKFSDFRPPESGLDVGPAGLLAAVDLFGSGVAEDLEELPLDAEVDVSALGELAALLGNVGGPAAFMLLGKSFHNNFQAIVLGKAATKDAAQARLAAKRMAEVDRLAYQTAQEEAAKKGQKLAPFDEWVKQNDLRIAAKQAAQKAAGEAAEEAGETASKKILKEVSEEVVEKAVTKGTTSASQKLGQKLAARASLAIIETLGKTGATVLGGVLMAIPAIIDVIMAIVDAAETDRFDAEITAAYQAGPNYDQDLKAMIAPNREYDAGLCYQWCKPGYSGLATLCYKDCPEGYENDPVTCRRDPDAISKERYHRGQTAMQCAPGQVQDAGLCYQPCADGYTGVANSCNLTSCPTGFRDDGLYCGKPAPYGRGGGYALWDRAICERDNAQGCEQSGAIIYPKCQENYHATGCCICSPDCPQGWEDIGVSCKKPTYDRGAGVAVSSCASGYEKIGALCYPTCNEGYTGELDWCTKHECPQGYRSDPLTCFRDAHIFGRESYDRGVGFLTASEVSCISDEKRLSNISALIGHMTKMMVADAADAGISIMPGDQIAPVAPKMMGLTAYN